MGPGPRARRTEGARGDEPGRARRSPVGVEGRQARHPAEARSGRGGEGDVLAGQEDRGPGGRSGGQVEGPAEDDDAETGVRQDGAVGRKTEGRKDGGWDSDIPRQPSVFPSFRRFRTSPTNTDSSPRDETGSPGP